LERNNEGNKRPHARGKEARPFHRQDEQGIRKEIGAEFSLVDNAFECGKEACQRERGV